MVKRSRERHAEPATQTIQERTYEFSRAAVFRSSTAISRSGFSRRWPPASRWARSFPASRGSSTAFQVGTTNVPIALGPHPDDVSAVRQGALRGAARRLPGHEGARPLARPELGGRPGPDVRAGDHLPARQAGIHGRPDPHRPRPLHRHGDRVERDRRGLDRIRGRPRRLQLDLPGAVLQRLRLVFRHRAAAAVRAVRLGRQHLHRPDRARASSSIWASPASPGC